MTGKVRRPGIVVLDTGARVVDALEAAGGERKGVDLSTLNLARVLVDGEQIVVGATQAAVPAVPSGSAVPGAPTTLVNLNTASQAELETLPDVGPVTALAILAWRDEHGGFTSVDELLEVDGIGETTLEQPGAVRHRVTATPPLARTVLQERAMQDGDQVAAGDDPDQPVLLVDDRHHLEARPASSRAPGRRPESARGSW